MGADPEISESSEVVQTVDKRAAVQQAEKEEITKGPSASNIDMVMKGFYIILLLIMILAIAQLYFSIQEIINIWLDEDYVPIANSLYYIIIIAGCVYIISKMQSWRSKGE